VPEIARLLNISAKPVRLWIKRFNAVGLVGLKDEPRSGRPTTYTAEQVGEVIAASLTNPQSLGLPFGSWTLDRLAAYLDERKGIPIKRSRIDEILIGEGLRWRTQETWFGDRVDPEFAQKRGISPGCIPRHRQGV
jgi:transposase